MIYWEELDQNIGGTLFRTKVPGGWLVKEVQEVCTQLPGDRSDSGLEWRSTLAYVPDPTHSWE